MVKSDNKKWGQSVKWDHKCSMVISLTEGDKVLHTESASPATPVRRKAYAGMTATVILAEKKGVLVVEPADIVYTVVFGAYGAMSSIPEAEKGKALTIIIHTGETSERLAKKD